MNIIDQMVAQGVPFAREYGGLLDNRSFGGAQVSRTFYARGQTGQQLLLGAYQQMARQVGLGNVKLWNRIELVDVVVDRRPLRRHRHPRPADRRDRVAQPPTPSSSCTGGYGNAFFLSTNAMACNVTAAWRAHRKGAYFANPCYTQIHPTCIPQADDFQSKLTLMSESLRNDGRVWVPKNAGDERAADQIPEDERDYYLERLYPSFGNLAPRDISSRAAKRAVDSGRGVGPLKNGVYLDFADAIDRLGEDVVRERYGNLFEMYERITGENPYQTPMRIYPASHYTMGGLWVDYELMTTIPGLYCAGEANFSDHGANRLGASALMQGLADGYFVLPYTMGNYLAPMLNKPIPGTDHPAFKAAESQAPRALRPLPRDRRHPLARLLPPRARQDHLGLLRHGAQRGRPGEGAVGDPGAVRRVPEGPARHRARRAGQPDAREGRPGRRLLPARHADVPRRARSAGRAAAATSAPSTRPRRARPCATTSTSPTSRRGSGRATRWRPSATSEELEYETVHFQTRSYK